MTLFTSEIYELELALDFHDLEAGRSIGSTRRRLVRQVRLLEVELDRLDPTVPDPGVSLERHYEDIRRLTSWRAGALCHRNGWEVEDLIADVVVAVEVRNRGVCPWDRRRGSLSHYIVMVISGLVSQQLAKRRRRPILVSDTITVDGEEVPMILADLPVDMDRRIDTQKRWASFHEDHGPELDALIDADGSIRSAARARGINARKMRPIAMNARAILRGEHHHARPRR